MIDDTIRLECKSALKQYYRKMTKWFIKPLNFHTLDLTELCIIFKFPIGNCLKIKWCILLEDCRCIIFKMNLNQKIYFNTECGLLESNDNIYLENCEEKNY